jgi:hypothetical protein
MNGWKDVNDDSPFEGVDEVDGLVYTDTVDSPELRDMPHGPAMPPVPVRRPPPQRPQPRSLPEWKPGGDVEAPAPRRKLKRTAPVQGIVVGIIPLVLLVFLILGVMHLYGLR